MKKFEGKIFDVEERDGKDVVVHGPAVAVVPVDREGVVTLVRQDRAGAGGPLLELPAGNVEDGEAPLASAQRELAEETGLHGGVWTEVASFFVTPGYCDERIHLFLARDLDQGEASPEGTEEIELVRVPPADVPGLIADVEDAKTLAGLLILLRHEHL